VDEDPVAGLDGGDGLGGRDDAQMETLLGAGRYQSDTGGGCDKMCAFSVATHSAKMGDP
jgi:hypothetical protein